MSKTFVSRLFCCSVAVLGTASLAGCGNDHPIGDGDAGIMLPDAARSDAYVEDSGPALSNVGAACAADTDCMGTTNTCLDFLGPDGYCTQTCDAMTACPTGSECIDFGGGNGAYCLLSCDPTVTTRQCNGRLGYGCATNPMIGAVCVGGCVDASDCGAGLMCDPTGGDLGSGTCFTPGAMIGAACTMDTECPSGGLCQAEEFSGWPGGACIGDPTPSCDPATNTGCTGDAQCVLFQGVFGPPGGLCVDGCTTSTDCRVGYTCTPATSNPSVHYCAPGCTTSAQCTGGRVCNVGLGTCAPAFDAGQLGNVCSFRDPTTCLGGTCLSERSSGFPNAYCSYGGCSATSPCPGTGVCAPRFGSANTCLKACTADTDCRTGYRCLPSDPSMPTSATACVPACTADTDCTRTGDVCNVGTGLCGPAFTPTLLGMACINDSGCAGGRCYSESATGYPAGECVYPGCSLSGGTGATCPTGSACVDDGLGSPDLGICAPTCAVGGSTCRDGYACVAIGGSATEGAGQPSCTATSCGPGRTCDAATHLCR